ncbi:MAG: class I SAM-dependent methyltransferase [Odoribacter sp.]|nr:class I SAM-dependent methyltransferase [Odoribacter sp.]
MEQDFFDWIDRHMTDDTSRLRLKYGKDRADEILQIECRRRFDDKLHHILATDPKFIFPTALAGEQSTSEALARFHASLIAPGTTVADFTSGLGIDVMAMASRASQVTAIEINKNVTEALRHNLRGFDNVRVVNDDCRHFADLALSKGIEFDTIFIDPARRDNTGGRVYALSDCSPDVIEMLPVLKQLCSRLIIKASPMLDISHSLSVLADVAEVISIGSTTECKELDFVLDFRNPVSTPVISAVTILSDSSLSRFTFTREEEADATVDYGQPAVGEYILNPYPAVMKAGSMKLLAARFGLKKAAPNTHVWFGSEIPAGFPGKAYRITEILPYASRHIKRYATNHSRISVTTRNFDMTADTLRSKLGVKDGPGRLFAISDACGNRWLVTTENV